MPPPPKPGAVTPATADQIVRTYAVREWNAMRTWSTAQQSRLELPPQVTIDNATWDYNKAAHVPTLKPPADLARIPITVMVPENARVFEALTNGGYIVFVKHGGTWMQQYSPGKAPGAPALTPKLNARGFAELVSGSDHARLKWSVSAVAALYAADLADAARGTPAPDPSFVAGPYTRGLWNSLSAQGYTEATAAAAAYPTYAFSLQGGGALVFFAVRLVTTATAPAGSTITVAPNSGFSAFINPGSYQTVTNTELLDVAAVIPPASSSSGVKVVGLADAVIAITGTGASGLA